MTYGDILKDFRKKYDINVNDYRPADMHFVEGKCGITIWTDNGDVLLYFPKEVKNGENS